MCHSRALEVTAEAIKSSGRDVECGVRNAVLIKLGNGPAADLVLQNDAHGLPALESKIGAGHHVGHFDVAGEPFVPVTIVVFFEAGVGNQVIVDRRENCEWRRGNRARRIDRANFVKV